MNLNDVARSKEAVKKATVLPISGVADMGKSAFLSWSSVTGILYDWTRNYFTPNEAVAAYGENDDNSFLIHFVGNTPEHADAVKALFDIYDTEGEYDWEDEFSCNGTDTILPETISFRLLQEILDGTLGFTPHSWVCGYDGLYFFEGKRS